MKELSPELTRLLIKAIAKLVAEGKLEYTTVNGKPAVRLIEKERSDD